MTNSPMYRTEFPGFDFEVPAVVTTDWQFEDTSWGAETNPSFTCDVFVLHIDYTDRLKREFPNGPQFVMMCEGETYLETDSWEDVRAFVEDGKRDHPAYDHLSTIDALVKAYDAGCERLGLPKVSADEQDLSGATAEQAVWLATFVDRWETEAQDPAFYDQQTVVEA